MDCFAEPVIGRRFAPTRRLAMTRLQILRKEPSRRDVALRIGSSFAVSRSGFVLRNVFAQDAFVALQLPVAIRPLGEPFGNSDLRVHCAGGVGDAGLLTGGDDFFETKLAVAENGDESDEHGDLR
jgi:hypothetical protein